MGKTISNGARLGFEAKLCAHAGGYVGAEVVEEEGEPFEGKMARLIKELNEQFAESARLETAIKKNLGELRYDG